MAVKVKLQIQIRGLDGVNNQLAALISQAPELGGKALRAEAEIEMTEAKRRTPVDTGALRDSGFVDGPNNGEVTLTFGGPAAPYAVEVHENLEAYHDDGQAKFLEGAVMEALPYLVERVAERMNVDIEGMFSGKAPSESFDAATYEPSDPGDEDGE